MEFDPNESEFTPLQEGVATLTVSEVTKKFIAEGKKGAGRAYWAVKFNATDEAGNTGRVSDVVMPWSMKGFLESLGRTDLIKPDATTGKVNVETYQVLQYMCKANIVNKEVVGNKGDKITFTNVKNYIPKDGPAILQALPTKQEIEEDIPF
jgi:hypothetical protein